MKVLAVDVGGTHVKILATGQDQRREFESGPDLSAAQMVERVKALAGDWAYDRVTVGYPGPVRHDRPTAEPHNLGRGWLGFDFGRAFGCPTRAMNDAAMQALGSYRRGLMLFLGFGTGLGTALVVQGIVVPMEFGHLPYRKATYEDYVGLRGLQRFGRKKWRRFVVDVIERLTAALEPDEIVLGGGNAALLKELPPRCRLGDNANAFVGGFRAWEARTEAPRAAGRVPRADGTPAHRVPGRPRAEHPTPGGQALAVRTKTRIGRP